MLLLLFYTGPRVKRVFRIFDHVSIFILIAGSYTPLVLVTIRGPLGWTLFGLVWGLALIGIIMKSIFIDRFKKFSVVLYLLMGWI